MEIFEEGQLEKLYAEKTGAPEESTLAFMHRMLRKALVFVCNPQQQKYATKDLLYSSGSGHNYVVPVFPFTVDSSGVPLACVLWELLPCTDTILLYVHTNTRSLADAMEVLHLCESLKINLVAFDLPGSGHSGGKLMIDVVAQLANVVAYCETELHSKRIILWGRGTGTIPVIQFCAKNQGNTLIRHVVLDTPFTSVKRVVEELVLKYKSSGNYFPQTVFQVVNKIFRLSITSRNSGADVYSIEPINLAASISLPCSILAATEDDYIDPKHGTDIQQVQ